MTRLAAVLLLLALPLSAGTFDGGGPRTTNNDDTCDIALLPAATLLVPYFEVDLAAAPGQGETTLFTVTNLSNVEQIAHVTLWTDLSYPVLGFDIYLTGYDVQSINLYDVLKLGQIGPQRGTGTTISNDGDYSRANADLNLRGCDRLPGTIDTHYLTRLQRAFTLGVAPSAGPLPACTSIGQKHANAIGFATIDVVGACTNFLTPADAAYYEGLLRFDNVLMGDVLQVDGNGDHAQGAPMVHIRAVPEGADLATRLANPAVYETNLPRTFYSRLQPGFAKNRDARQPLPSRTAGRWISGGAGEFRTSVKVWREGVTPPLAACGQYAPDARWDAEEVVVFDEEENPVGYDFRCFSSCTPIPPPRFLSTGRYDVDSDWFPQLESDATAGWYALNLDTGTPEFAAQMWAVSSMRAENRFSVDVETVALGNGCSPAVPVSEISPRGITPLVPAANVNAPLFTSGGPTTTNNDDSCDIGLFPAATLLLPYFEVDLNAPAGQGETTLFSVTNLSNVEQIAHVTLWTDYAYPVLSFDIYLTGYDVQSVNLYDILKFGQIGSGRGMGAQVSPQGDFSRRHVGPSFANCDRLPGQIPSIYVERLQQAFTRGTAPAAGSLPQCTRIGRQHANAVGYATIDVVDACNTLLTPADRAYYAGVLRFDNVLMGDSIQLNGAQDRAEGSPMVHIRAVPEGAGGATNLTRTFYGRFQTALNPVADKRQPLPSVYAARWIAGGAGGFETSFRIWREGVAGANAACAEYDLERHGIVESVAVDEDENAIGAAPDCGGPSPCIPVVLPFPATASYRAAGDGVFPEFDGGIERLGGWMYLNLDSPDRPGATQGWVVTSMRAEGRFAIANDAVALGNGCSPASAVSEVTFGPVVLGPLPNPNP